MRVSTIVRVGSARGTPFVSLRRRRRGAGRCGGGLRGGRLRGGRLAAADRRGRGRRGRAAAGAGRGVRVARVARSLGLGGRGVPGRRRARSRGPCRARWRRRRPAARRRARRPCGAAFWAFASAFDAAFPLPFFWAFATWVLLAGLERECTRRVITRARSARVGPVPRHGRARPPAVLGGAVPRSDRGAAAPVRSPCRAGADDRRAATVRAIHVHPPAAPAAPRRARRSGSTAAPSTNRSARASRRWPGGPVLPRTCASPAMRGGARRGARPATARDQLEAISPWIACRWGIATRVRRRRSNR